MRRYYRLFKNAADDKRLASAVGQKLTGMVGRRAIQVGAFALMAVALRGLSEVYNNLVYPAWSGDDDAEDDLPEQVRERAHVILYRDADGNVKYFSRIGAGDDVLEWFGLSGAPQYARDYFTGRRTMSEIAEDMAKTPINKLVSGLGVFKMASELLMGTELFPDMFKPRAIRDRGLYIAKNLGIETPYRKAMDLPSRGWGKAFSKTVGYTADPLESGYNATYDAKTRFLKNIGKARQGGAWFDDRSSALYNGRLAARYGDREAVARYVAEYANLGGTPGGIRQSFENMHPTSGMNREDKKKFLDSLSENEKRQLAQAVRFYDEVILGGETPLKMAVDATPAMIASPQGRQDARSEVVELWALYANSRDPAERAEYLRQRQELVNLFGGLPGLLKSWHQDLAADAKAEGRRPIPGSRMKQMLIGRVKARAKDMKQKAMRPAAD